MKMIKSINFPQVFKPLLPELSEAFEEFILKGEYVGYSSYTEKFESQVKEFLGAKHVIGCKNGTSALQLSLLAANIGHGDEVITVANTFYATAYAIKSVGANPVFCEVLASNGLIDPEDAKKKITKKTKAILPVHLYGIPVDLHQLRTLCKESDLTLIEDCAHAFGSMYQKKPIGTDSDYACFSLHSTKSLGGFGNAGMVVTQNDDIATRLRELIFLTNDKRDEYDPLALQARIDPLQACLLRVNLNHFPSTAQHRKDIANVYTSRLRDYFRISPHINEEEIVRYMFPIFSPDRKDLITFAHDRGVELRVHYDIDLHRLKQFGAQPIGTLPLTEKHNREVLSLSVHPSRCGVYL
jgi:dTDP-4-amino-4,6-dideoxygalactose transaminase